MMKPTEQNLQAAWRYIFFKHILNRFSMVLGDIFAIVIAIIANNYKSVNLKDSIKKLKKSK